jgi:hypothetical protein
LQLEEREERFFAAARPTHRGGREEKAPIGRSAFPAEIAAAELPLNEPRKNKVGMQAGAELPHSKG